MSGSLNERMKENYENRSKIYLTRRVPVIIRLDGKAFHTLTRGLKRPYDAILHKTMNATMEYLCKNIQGCKIGYTQSDEITLLLTDFDTLDTDAWFNYSVQKICSVSASMATFAFNKYFKEFSRDTLRRINNVFACSQEEAEYATTLEKIIEKGGMFDARCFNIPENEVVNCFVWRQQDATRNAIQMLGQTYFSHNELQDKTCNEIQDMLMLQKGINFNDMPVEFKRGVCCVRETEQNPDIDIKDGYYPVTSWKLDMNIPIFTKDRVYIEKRYEVKE